MSPPPGRRDLLVAPVCGDQLIEGWLSVLDPVLYPQSRDRAISSPAPGCPTFGTDSVLDRGPKGAVLLAVGQPRLHHPIPGGAPVVWWDPRRLVLSVEEPLPLRHQQILEASSEAATASETAYTTWMERGEALRSRATQPSLTVKTVTALARRAGAAPESSRGTARSSTLAFIRRARQYELKPSRAKQKPAPAVAVWGSRACCSASIDLDAVLAAIRATSAVSGAHHRRFRRGDRSRRSDRLDGPPASHPPARCGMHREGTIRRETPVLLALEDGALVEGVVDFAFRDRDGDFEAGPSSTSRQTRNTQHHRLSTLTRSCSIQGYRVATAMPARGILLLL